ncbi:MAG: hypothetical protein ACK5ME_00440, partial [Parahaliea sp.]
MTGYISPPEAGQTVFRMSDVPGFSSQLCAPGVEGAVIAEGVLRSWYLPDGVFCSFSHLRVIQGSALRRTFEPGIYLNCALAGEMPARRDSGEPVIETRSGRVTLTRIMENESLQTQLISGRYLGIGFRLPSNWLQQDEPLLRHLALSLEQEGTLSRPLPPLLERSICAFGEASDQGPLARLCSQSAGIDLLLTLIARFEKDFEGASPPSAKRRDRVLAICALIEERIDDLPSLVELASFAATNVRTLNVDFRAVTGMSVFA